MGKVLFSQVSVCPHLGGYPSPRFFPRLLTSYPFQVVPQSQSQVLSRLLVPGHFWGYPSPVPGSFPGPFQGVPQACHGVPQSWQGYPSPVMGTLSPGWGNPSQVRMGYPLARIGLGVHPSQDWGTPQLGQDGVPLAGIELRWPLPWPGVGYPQDRTAKRTFATRAGMLLCSRRRTSCFLFVFVAVLRQYNDFANYL